MKNEEIEQLKEAIMSLAHQVEINAQMHFPLDTGIRTADTIKRILKIKK